MVLPYSSKEYRPVELGASIFVKANRNLWRAAQEFNLSFAQYDGEDGEFAIWDGSEFRFRVCGNFVRINNRSCSDFNNTGPNDQR